MKPIDLTVKPDSKDNNMCCGPRTPDLYLELDADPNLPAEGIITLEYKITEKTVRTPSEDDSKDSCYRPLVKLCLEISTILDAKESNADTKPKTDYSASSDALDEMLSEKPKTVTVVVAKK